MDCLIWFVLESGEGCSWAAPGTGTPLSSGGMSRWVWRALGRVPGHGENGPGTVNDTGPGPAAAERQEAGVLKKHSSWEVAGL